MVSVNFHLREDLDGGSGELCQITQAGEYILLSVQVNSSLQRSIAWRYKSRYATEFVEGALLGTGGFGAVYVATNRLI